MESAPDPIVQRHRLRVELRQERTNAELSQREVAKRLGWSSSKLLRIETGQSGVSRTDLKALLEQYGVTDSTRIAALSQLAEESRRHPWGRYRDVLNPEFLVHLGYEGAASTLMQYHHLAIPGLLQTEEYVQSIIRAFAKPGTSDQTIRRQIEVRLKRQAVFERANPPKAAFILDESSVRRSPGQGVAGASIMRRQLAHLRRLNESPLINIQILPFSFGLRDGMQNPFVLLGFADSEGVLLHLEGHKSTLSLDDPVQVDHYRKVFEDLRTSATPPEMLDEVLNRVADEGPI